MSSGLMAGKRGMNGNNAAYDMKSLGRHTEICCSNNKLPTAQQLRLTLLLLDSTSKLGFLAAETLTVDVLDLQR